MVRIYFRKFRSRRLYANSQAFRQVITEGMNREIAPAIKQAMGRRVENWEVGVGFIHEVTIERTGVSLYVLPTGEGARFWVWVSRGVSGHPIRPRRERSAHDPRYRAALKIYSYSPKTSPGGGFGFAGVKAFVGYAAYVPWWPGIAPRLFEEHVATELNPWFRRTMENIMRRATRAAMRRALQFWKR